MFERLMPRIESVFLRLEFTGCHNELSFPQRTAVILRCLTLKMGNCMEYRKIDGVSVWG